MKVMLIGAPAAGKTTYISASYGYVFDFGITTRDSILFGRKI
ncbi:MAG: hypothetical protein RBR71_11470 [Gudongella sp.]|nr:hypothetical protein [Gudongella sp.]